METICDPPKLIHLFTLRCTVAQPLDISHRRRCVPIHSGSVGGKYITGKVVHAPAGADFLYSFLL